MKVNFLVSVFLSMLIGCSSLQIDESATHKAIAYTSGKGVAIGINSISPETDVDLTASWSRFMDHNRGNAEISSTEMLMFYNNCLAIIGIRVDDGYGLLGDLGAMLTIFGAQFSDDSGEMTFIKSVPYSVMQFFEMGYSNGRIVGSKIYQTR